MNLTSNCNAECNCEYVKYAPVCHEPSQTTFFSACHAGCSTIEDDKEFGNCSCVPLITLDFLNDDRSDENNGKKGHIENELEGFDVRLSFNFNKVRAGPCPSSCNGPYLLFMVLTCIIQTLACSGKIGNVLVNYRSVEKKDKSFAQGVTLMIISLFALIPGPIIYGAIIDSTCLIWEESCGTRGNCWFHHRENFRYLVNITSAGWYYIC